MTSTKGTLELTVDELRLLSHALLGDPLAIVDPDDKRSALWKKIDAELAERLGQAP